MYNRFSLFGNNIMKNKFLKSYDEFFWIFIIGSFIGFIHENLLKYLVIIVIILIIIFTCYYIKITDIKNKKAYKKVNKIHTKLHNQTKSKTKKKKNKKQKKNKKK